MEVYAGLFLVALGIAYLTVRSIQSRTVGTVEKTVKTNSTSASRGNPAGRTPASRTPASRTPASRTLRRSTLVAGSIQKPWGW